MRQLKLRTGTTRLDFQRADSLSTDYAAWSQQITVVRPGRRLRGGGGSSCMAPFISIGSCPTEASKSTLREGELGGLRTRKSSARSAITIRLPEFRSRGR